MEYDIKEYQKKLVLLMKEFDSFCTENGLRYSMAYGSLLGVARHNGFIPWDDDIDVIMPRVDYDRFISMTKKQMTDGYEVICSYNNRNYYLPFAKVVDINTTIVERKRNLKCPIGVFIDVFPIDGASDASTYPSLKQRKYNRHAGWASIMINGFFLHAGIVNTIKRLVLCLFTTANDEYKKADSIASSVPFEESVKVCCYAGTYKQKEIIPRIWFDEYVDMPFEGIQVKCISHWKEYLTQFYGDYMELPPVEQRISHHYHYLIDLSRRWTSEEIRNFNMPDEQNIEYTYE